MLVLDSGGVSYLAERSQDALADIRELKRSGLWPPLVPSAVLIECLTGDRRDAPVNQLIKSCDVVEELTVAVARRAASLRAVARRGSAVDGLVVTTAEPGGLVLTGDSDDLEALAAQSRGVTIRTI